VDSSYCCRHDGTVAAISLAFFTRWAPWYRSWNSNVLKTRWKWQKRPINQARKRRRESWYHQCSAGCYYVWRTRSFYLVLLSVRFPRVIKTTSLNLILLIPWWESCVQQGRIMSNEARVCRIRPIKHAYLLVWRQPRRRSPIPKSWCYFAVSHRCSSFPDIKNSSFAVLDPLERPWSSKQGKETSWSNTLAQCHCATPPKKHSRESSCILFLFDVCFLVFIKIDTFWLSWWFKWVD
jgi:hypothetical protein